MLAAPLKLGAACALAGPSPHRYPHLPSRAPHQPLSRLRQLRCPPSGRGGRDSAAPIAGAVRHGGETMAVPLDYYKLLGVSGVCSRDSLARALEKALTSPPDVGYSQQCLLARGSLLKRAVETLLDPTARHAYDENLRLGEITEEVPDEFAAGVLALLLEAGEGQTVVAAGEEWLSTHRRDGRARDVALSTALAHRQVAESRVRKQGDAASAAGMLRVAAELLRRFRAPAPLQAEVVGALTELQPLLACQLAALPLERFTERRRGVQVAIAVLTDSSGAKRGMGKQQFLDALAEHLTAEEQIEVYEAAGVRYAELPSELYNVALAYIADAAATGRAAHLERALLALAAAAAAVPPGATGQSSDSGVRQLAERRAIDERNRRQVAACVCHLLLGDTAAAADTLGLGPGGAAQCERSMLAFIRANSPDPADSLPGMCVLAQRWVADVALGSFRASQGAPFSLETWFALDPVRRYLAGREQGLPAGAAPAHPALAAARSSAAAVAAPLVGSLAAVLDLLGLLASSGQQLLWDGEESEQQEAGDEGLGLDGSVASGGAPAAARAAPAAPSAAATPPEHSQPAREPAGRPAAAVLPRVPAGRSPAEVTAAAAARDMSRVDMRASRSSRPVGKPAAPARGEPAPPRELQPRHTARPELTAAGAPVPLPPAAPPAAEAAGEEFDANVALAMQPVAQLTPLENESRMWDGVEQRNVRWGRLAATVALLAGGGFLLGRGVVAQQQAATAAPAAVTVAAPAAAATPALTRAQAAAVIGQWQGVKARALGPQHDIRGLAAVLRGDVLKQWQERAQQIQGKGWHYLHTLEASQVNSVRAAPDGTALVSATFREAVEAHRGAQEAVQAFRSEYSVDYELVHEAGSWAITGAVVRY